MQCQLQTPASPWQIDLTRDDVEKFWTILHTLQLDETSNEVLWFTIRDKSRCWFAFDANVLMWGIVESVESIEQLMIPFTPTALNSLFNFLMAHETCTLTVEMDEIPQNHVAVIRSASGDSFCANIPVVTQSMPDIGAHGDTSCDLSHEQIHMLGDFMRMWPAGVSPEGQPTPFLPAFAHLSIDGSGVRCSMDWTRYGGHLNTVSLSANGVGNGAIQFDATVVARALSRLHEDGAMTVSFHSEGRTAVHFHNDSWGFKALAARESVVRWGRLLLTSIEELEFEGHGDVTMGRWDADALVPTVEFTFRDTQMTLALVSDVNGRDDFVRVALNVANNVVFNLELMQELNTYNNRTLGLSAVFDSDSVFLVADVPCASYVTSLARAVLRVFEHQHDLVAVVAMYGDGPALFDEAGNPTS